jgi:hypothetical protein
MSLRYPLAVFNGSLVYQLEDNVVKEAILSALFTYQNERVLNPGYGTDLEVFKLLPELGDILGELENRVSESLSEYGDITLTFYGSMAEEGLLDLSVLYTTDTIDDGSISIELVV